jgi:hypothetical protein
LLRFVNRIAIVGHQHGLPGHFERPPMAMPPLRRGEPTIAGDGDKFQRQDFLQDVKGSLALTSVVGCGDSSGLW